MHYTESNNPEEFSGFYKEGDSLTPLDEINPTEKICEGCGVSMIGGMNLCYACFCKVFIVNL